MRVGFYLSNGKLSGVDLSRPEEGNPGIGGTEYQFICLPYYIDKYYPSEIEFYFYAQNVDFLPEVVRYRIASNIKEACQFAIEDACDILVWRPTESTETLGFIESINNDKESIKLIAWVHNSLPNEYLYALSSCEMVKRYVAVSDEQLDIIRQEPIIYKACVITNGLDTAIYEDSAVDFVDRNMVVYVGALVPAKGFGMLARVWKKILERNKDARLYVIGSGKLYDRGQVLGKWGVAEESFEAEFIRPYLSDDAGNVHSSVKFLGTLGAEKIEYMRNACVGVVNPTALTENCPGSALEFQALGTPVVSGADWGLLDTVLDGVTGLLGKTDENLIENILYFMKNTDKSLSFGASGVEFVKRKFSYSNVTKDWLQLFKDVASGERNIVKPIYKNYLYKKKWLREVVRLAREDLYSQTYGDLTVSVDENDVGRNSDVLNEIYRDRLISELLKNTETAEKKYKKLVNDLEYKDSQLINIYNSRRWKFLELVMGMFGKSWR